MLDKPETNVETFKELEMMFEDVAHYFCRLFEGDFPPPSRNYHTQDRALPSACPVLV